MNRYLILIHYPAGTWSEASALQQAAWANQHDDFARVAGDQVLSSEALADPAVATTVGRDRVGGLLISDGPFVEAAEVLGGFYLVQASDLDQVISWCALLPDCYTLDIRPIADPG